MWFFTFLFGMILIVPVHFLSVEHTKLQAKYGKEKGIKIGDALGLISGWGFFAFWFGIWLSPQEVFLIPILPDAIISIPYVVMQIPVVHLAMSLPLIAVGAWLGIKGVGETSLKAAEIHRSEKVVTSGVYSKIRHPQYLGGILAHLGITLLLSAFYALLATPIIVLLNYLTSWKEEKELVIEFGEEYEDYQKRVPMFLPRFRSSDSD
ncbi:MAG: methyltransferase family protein [Candidatus Thorarchaeota archaeon]|jgi:protein-S-isoprenylcysteine O-methyltransferase Ste14